MIQKEIKEETQLKEVSLETPPKGNEASDEKTEETSELVGFDKFKNKLCIILLKMLQLSTKRNKVNILIKT